MKIDKYKIIEEIGRGGMGVAYKAYDPHIDRQVAIKVIKEKILERPQIKERFYYEAKSAGKLSHPNITIIHDVGEANGQPYIVMEYLEGLDLSRIIEERKRLSVIQKLQIALQVCSALEYSHSCRVVHRDIKPGNIKVLRDGRVKIMDFGLAKLPESSLTIEGDLIGTPYYMSPEQINSGTIDHRTDIFSFGIVLYELLTYQLPFRGSSRHSVMYKIVNSAPEPFRLSGDDPHSELANYSVLEEVINKCLEKNPDRRYQSCGELEKALHEVLRGSAKGVKGNRFKIADLLKRRTAAIVSAFVMILMIAGVIGYLYFGTQSEMGGVALNIFPWAEITGISNANGDTVPYPLNSASGIFTPCYLELPEGTYHIQLKHPKFDPFLLEIKVDAAQPQIISKSLPGFKYETIFSSL